LSATIIMGHEHAKSAADSGRVVSLHPEMKEADLTSVVGMVVFLGSWAMIFLALFFSYLLIRVNAVFWPPVGFEELPVLMPTLNTVFMVASSLVYHRGWRALQRGDAQVYSRYLLGTIALGLLFMILQGRLWFSLWSGGLELSSGLFGGFFYLLTFFHAFHVLVGLALLVWLQFKMWRSAGVATRGTRARVVGLFWHFVDVAWVATFFLIFVL
jgi:cytochrome c oxidase subunit 3